MQGEKHSHVLLWIAVILLFFLTYDSEEWEMKIAKFFGTEQMEEALGDDYE